MINYEKKKLNTKQLLDSFKDDIASILVDYKLKSVDYNLKVIESYTDLECPCLKIAPTGLETLNESSMGSSRVHITFFAYVIYNNKNKNKDDIYLIVDELLQKFNGKSFKNNTLGLAISTEITSVTYSNPLKLNEHSAVEIEFLILTTI